MVKALLVRGDEAAAIPWLDRVIAEDPLLEEAHRLLMSAYGRAGERSLAMRTYDQCVAVLAEELGVEPLAETTALWQQIQTAGKRL